MREARTAEGGTDSRDTCAERRCRNGCVAAAGASRTYRRAFPTASGLSRIFGDFEAAEWRTLSLPIRCLTL